MTQYFSRSFFLLLFLFSLNLLSVPIPAEAAIVPCGRTADDPATSINEAAPCTVCHLIVGGEGLIQWGLQVMTYIAVAVIVAMGILYIVSAGNEEMMGTAKHGITASLIGFAVMLGAWLIVNTVITILADTSDPTKPLSSLRSEGTFRFTCDVTSNVGSASGVTTNPGTVETGKPTGGGTSTHTGSGTKYGNGKCEPVSAGPCSVENLRKTCFGNNAEVASIVCNKESFGDPVLPSGVDKCQPGREVASWGLFQINLSSHQVGGLNCPAPTGAFDRMYTGANKTCSVRQSLYNSCVEKAKDAFANIERACAISKNGTDWSAWTRTKRICGI